MIKKIPNDLINTLVKNTDIVELIKNYVNLTHKGKNFVSLCPFHNEKTPSFTVSYEKQFFYCFGCGIHGNVIDFLINYNKYSFIDSIKELSEINNFYLKKFYFFKKKYLNIYNFFNFLNKINNFYQENLKKKNSLKAINYLKKRGISDNIISYFNIGFSNKEWQNISNIFGTSEKNKKILLYTGMIAYSKNGNIYDRFRERIMFPIKNNYGNTIAFGARSINNILPKYINSPETKIFSKKNQLYGLYEIKKNKKNLKKLLLVEGYFDVITLFEYNIKYAVASLGTSINSYHIKTLYKFTNKLICCYDGDNAGKKAAWKLLIKSLSSLKDGYELQFVFLPEKEDPDTLIKKIGKKNFEKLINNSKPFSEFLFEKLLFKYNLINIENRVKFIIKILPLIQKIPGNNLKLHLRKKLSDMLGIFNENELKKFLPINNNLNIFLNKNNMKNTIMRIIIGLLIQNPKLYSYVPDTKNFVSCKKPGIKLLIKIINFIKNNKNITTGFLIELFRNSTYYIQIKKMASWDHMISDNFIKKTFLDAIRKLKNSLLVDRQESLLILERTRGLNNFEKQELWNINKFLIKNK